MGLYAVLKAYLDSKKQILLFSKKKKKKKAQEVQLNPLGSWSGTAHSVGGPSSGVLVKNNWTRTVGSRL